MTKRTRLPPAPKPAPTPQPAKRKRYPPPASVWDEPSNRTRATRAERGLSAIEVALPSALAAAIRAEAAYQGLSVAGLVAGWAAKIAARQERRARMLGTFANRQAKSKKG